MTKETDLQTTSLLPDNYKVPDKKKQFMKLQPGDNPIRILAPPLIGYVYFTEDKKPVRRPYDPDSTTLGDFTKEELETGNAKRKEDGNFEGSRHFWMLLVWDYTDNIPRMLDITQMTITKPLHDLLDNSKWGDFRKYDINILRRGTGQYDTEFTVTPEPHSDVIPEIQEFTEWANTSGLLDMNKIWTGEYPFQKYLW